MRVVTFKSEEDLVELLDSYAMRHGLNRSEAIRKIIEKVVKVYINVFSYHSLSFRVITPLTSSLFSQPLPQGSYHYLGPPLPLSL